MNDFNFTIHLWIGICGYLAYALLYQPGLKTFIFGLIAVAIASLLADIDLLQSKLSQILFGGVTKVTLFVYSIIRIILSILITWICHAKFEYIINQFDNEDLVLGLVFITTFVILEPNENFVKRRVAESIGLILMIEGLIRGNEIALMTGSIILTYTIVGHRSFVSHSLLSLFHLGLAINILMPSILIPVMIGYGLHILCDELFEEEKCPLWDPIKIIVLAADRIITGKKAKKLRDTQVRDLQLTVIKEMCVFLIL